MICTKLRRLLPPSNEVGGKVICLQVCVCPQGGCYLSMYCRWYPSMPCSRSPGGGVCYPSMHCRWYPSKPCSRSPGGSPGPHPWGYGPGGGLVLGGPGPGGVLLVNGGCQVLGGCLLRGVPAPERGCLVETPWRLLLRAVRILLECFLYVPKGHEFELEIKPIELQPFMDW